MNDVSPLPGYWSPLSESGFDINYRRQDVNTTSEASRVVNIYRCAPITACLGANVSNGKVHGECMPGAYGPLCGMCNETDGYSTSKEGCRKCDASGTQQSTTTMFVCMYVCICIFHICVIIHTMVYSMYMCGDTYSYI